MTNMSKRNVQELKNSQRDPSVYHTAVIPNPTLNYSLDSILKIQGHPKKFYNYVLHWTWNESVIRSICQNDNNDKT